MLGGISTRARVLLAAAVAALPLIGLVGYAAVDRYDADRARATRSAGNRAMLFGTLLGEPEVGERPSSVRLERLLDLSPLPAGSALVVFDAHGRRVARAGPSGAGPSDGAATAAALARRAGTFDATGADGVERVWGIYPVGHGGSTVAFGLPGDGVYGPARTALRRDLVLALAAAALAFLVAFVLTGRATAPLRRLASRVSANGGGPDDISVIARGFDQLDEAVVMTTAELARRAERLAALRAIDQSILAADTPEAIAQAALVRLRGLLGAARIEVVLFDRRHRIASSLAIATEDGSGGAFGGDLAADDPLLRLDLLRAGQACVCNDLDTLESPSELGLLLRGQGIRSHAAVALTAEGELRGALKIGFSAPGAISDQDTLAAAREVADQLAIALRHAQLTEELQAVIDSAMEGIVVLDDERTFVSANTPACRLLGGDRDDLVGLKVADVIVSSSGDITLERVLAEGSAQGTVTVELVAGERRRLEVRGRAEFRPGRHLIVMRDLTERQRLEDQLRQAHKMEAVGLLAGGVAHDFNNLLTAISGWGDMGRRRVGAGPGAFELSEIERAAGRATQLTRQLLAFSRRQVLQPVALDLNEAANDLMPMLTRLIGEDIEIVVFAADELPAVLADRAQIEQVIINLALNARDAMPSGGTLTLETRATTLTEGYAGRHARVTPGDYVCLSVTDSGDGIDPATLEHIFEPFYTTKATGRGTGLGLATVHGIVAQSGGHVQVYTEPGLGATFKVYLPADPRNAIKPQPTPRIDREQLAGSETVLLCEDDDGVLHLIERILTDEGYVVLAAATPHEALALAAEYGDAIDVLVSDIVMPGMSGPELAAELKRAKPGLRTVMLSGYTAETAHSRGDLPLGGGFVEKPFERTGLLRALRDVLDPPTAPAQTASERTRRHDA